MQIVDLVSHACVSWVIKTKHQKEKPVHLFLVQKYLKAQIHSELSDVQNLNS
jgi:hypothetical protein